MNVGLQLTIIFIISLICFYELDYPLVYKMSETSEITRSQDVVLLILIILVLFFSGCKFRQVLHDEASFNSRI